MPPHAHQLPWVNSRAPAVFAAAPSRYSSALAPAHLPLLPPLLEEFVSRYDELGRYCPLLSVTVRYCPLLSGRYDELGGGERERMLHLLLPWLREAAAACTRAAEAAAGAGAGAGAEAEAEAGVGVEAEAGRRW